KPAICLKSSDDGQQEAQTIGLDLRDCANREFSIGVAAGAEKHAVVCACIRARYLNVLVTDEPTARFLLEEKDRRAFHESEVENERR
ncbi:MAG: sugar-binding domain-containing protein, partial [Roseiarcus sp.]